MQSRAARTVTVAMIVGVAIGATGASADEDRPIYVRPGAPGEATVRISPRDVAVSRTAPYSHHEVHFLQHMIPHHGQAVHMSALAVDRASDERVLNLARRIDVTQDGELAQMAQWLDRRDEDVPDPMDWHGHEGMPGMVSHEEMMELEAAEGHEFDVLFLELMIMHHLGAITMVENLEEATGPYVEPNIAVMAADIVDTQDTEIRRMQRLLDELRG